MPDELGPLFTPPSDGATFSFVAALIVCLAVATIVLCVIAVARGRILSDRGFSNFFAAGLVLVPVFVYAMGDLVLLEESKTVEFCGSCHVSMGPVMEAMRNDGGTLASIHYQRGAVSHAGACYQCHSGYGMYGTFSAKLAGLNHMIKTARGSYEFPLKVESAFDVDSCLNCHAAALPFRAVEAHRDRDLQAQLLSGELGCAGMCHVDAHPPDSLMGAPQ